MAKHTWTEENLLDTINRIIEDNIDNPNFSVEDLAEKTGLSRSMLHRRLRKLSGKSGSDLILERRLTLAREFLKNNVATVAEVAFRVGFRDPSYFNKVFQKRFKIPPGKVRNTIPTEPEKSTAEIEPQIQSPKRSKTYRYALWSFVIVLGIAIVSISTLYIFIPGNFREKSIAVLPLDNLTGEPENAYFVDGMHDALIGELGRIETLRVISRTSTLRYRNSDLLLKDIADELGVNTIVEGSVVGAGDSLKVIIQMIDVFPKERHLLAKEYHDEMPRILSVQNAVVKDIAHKIRVRLTKEEEELLANARIVNPEVYRNYLRGLHNLNHGTAESFETGIMYMEKAIEQDPGDPLAYAGLSLGYAIKGHGMIASQGSFRSAASAAERALRIDPELDEAYTALALLYLYQFWNWPAAEDAFLNALVKNPNNEIAHAHYAWYHVLFGDREKTLYHAEMAVTLEPYSASYHAWLAWLYYYFREYDKAEFHAKRSLELKDDIPYGNLVLGWIYLSKNEYEKAIELHEILPENEGYYKMLLVYSYVRAGEMEKALNLWNDLVAYSEKNWVNPFYSGMIAGMLGYTDKAFELLNETCDNKYYPINYIAIFPGIEYISGDPRYSNLLQKMNLPAPQILLTAQE